jgi:hypothetical protein
MKIYDDGGITKKLRSSIKVAIQLASDLTIITE